jgi:putative Holliday junction resolvase
VRLVDERLSTTVAARGMRASGVSSRAGRPAVDQAAAMVILQDALDAERATGEPPGEVLTVTDE